MSDEALGVDISNWFPTYGSLTAKRILERFNISVDNEELTTELKNPRSLFYQLLRVPLKNVFNGIILQQVHDYQVYAQKLLIDYLLSGEGEKSEKTPGADTREDLESQRLKLMEMSDAFEKLEHNHLKLISESQAALIKLSHELQDSVKRLSKTLRPILQQNKVIKADALIQKSIWGVISEYHQFDEEALSTSSPLWTKMARLLDATLSKEVCQELAAEFHAFHVPQDELEELISAFMERAMDIGINLRNFRSDFYSYILNISELISLLPEYHANEAQKLENRESLLFDSHLGGD